MSEGKVIDGTVKFEEGALLAEGSLNPNKDGDDVFSAKLKISSQELVQEIFQRAEGGTGTLVVFKPEFSGLSVGIKLALDTDKDGETVLELEAKLNLMEVTDEVMDAIAAARGKKMVAV